MKGRDPVIFIGMHRSGTSMLGRLLEGLGLFVGAKKDENNEAIMFQKINEWIMASCSARWDTPTPTRYLWDNEELLICVEEYVRYLLDSPRSIQYLGVKNYLKFGGITKINMPWGWKDPRNTFTLPLWLRIFPNAKVIYIERHGVDVANSLQQRAKKSFYDTVMKYKKYRFFIPYRPKKGGFIESVKCVNLSEGFDLWKEYISQAETVMQQIPRNRLLKLQYEQILMNPIVHLKESVSFCGLQVKEEKLEELANKINKSRAFAYYNDPLLRNFAQLNQKTLSDRGYSESSY